MKGIRQISRSGDEWSILGRFGGTTHRLVAGAELAYESPVLRARLTPGKLDVIEAIEGPIAVTECSDETTDSSCEYETNCGVRANWQRINHAVQSALSEITLADMAVPGTAELVSLARSSREANRLRTGLE